MADGPTLGEWAQLRSRRPAGDDTLTTTAIITDGKVTPLSMAIDQAGNLHLLIPMTCGPNGVPLCDLNGLKVRHRRLETGDVLDLAAPPSHERVFTPFCGDIVRAVIVERREPWKAVAATIRAWQSAWKPIRPTMEKTTQVGLFGELLVLRSLMIPCLGPAAVAQWSGPDYERHDFVGDHLNIEVKTTRKSRAEHEISRLDQLRPPRDGQLLFVSVQIEETVGGDNTVATQLDAVVDMLREDSTALDSFMTKLFNVGWSDEMRNSGELLRFNVRTAEVFVVDQDFPRLPDDFKVPSGVVAVRYTVDLANIPALGMDEANEIIKNGNWHKGQ